MNIIKPLYGKCVIVMDEAVLADACRAPQGGRNHRLRRICACEKQTHKFPLAEL